MTRPALAAGAVTLRDDGRVGVATPPDPKTDAEGVVLDALDFVHAVVTQIPDAGRHFLRYYGYAHKVRGCARALAAALPPAEAAGTTGAPEPSAAPAPCESVAPAEPGSPEARRRSACFRPDEGRRVLKVFEVDPLLCSKCGGRLRIVARITLGARHLRPELVQAAIEAVCVGLLGVGAALADSALAEDEDRIGVAHGGEQTREIGRDFPAPSPPRTRRSSRPARTANPPCVSRPKQPRAGQPGIAGAWLHGCAPGKIASPVPGGGPCSTCCARCST